MLRYYIRDKTHLQEWLVTLQSKKFHNKEEIAVFLNISRRTLTDWQRAKYGIPKCKFEKLEEICKYPYEDKIMRDDLELKRMSARLGGIATTSKGMIGDIESRRRGAIASLVTHKLKNTGLFQVKECKPFPHNKDVAELTGVIIGDGHLAPGQIEITLDAREMPYAKYLQNLLQSISNYEVVLRYRSKTVIALYLSGKAIVFEFHKLGIEYGNKTKKQGYIPDWILENNEFSRAFVKGIFDTDGCIYIDSHVINGKTYRHWGISQASNNQSFLEKVGQLLTKLGFHPTVSTKHRIILRRQNEVHLFMDTIQPANQKHIKGYPRMN